MAIWIDFLDRGWWTYEKFPTGVYASAERDLIPMEDLALWHAA